MSEGADVAASVSAALRAAAGALRGRAGTVLSIGDVPSVAIAPESLTRVLTALIERLAAGLPEGRGHEHRLRIASRRADGDRVSIDVGSTGPPIPDEERRCIFDAAATGPTALSEALDVVTRAGGALELASVDGRDRFQLIVPGAHAASPAALPPAREPPAERSGRARVLVVDDEPLVLRVIGRTLAMSHDVVTTSSPRDVLERLEHDRFDVIISDMVMPDLWGGALYDEIARRHPEMCERMVFLTGGSLHEEVTRFLERVPNPRLDKPFGADRLEAVIQQVLARARRASSER